MCLAQGPQRTDAGEARTREPSILPRVKHSSPEPLRSLYKLVSKVELTFLCFTFMFIPFVMIIVNESSCKM